MTVNGLDQWCSKPPETDRKQQSSNAYAWVKGTAEKKNQALQSLRWAVNESTKNGMDCNDE